MIYTFISILLLTTFLYSEQNTSDSSKKALAILNFEALSITEDESYILTQGLITELINIGHYRIIERGNIDKILKEQQFQTSGCTNSECAVEIGQLINSDYVLIGTVSRLGSTYRIDARIIDVESGEAINSAAYNKKGDIEILLEGTKSIANQLSGLEGTNKYLKEKESTSKNKYDITVGNSFVWGDKDAPITIIKFHNFKSINGYKEYLLEKKIIKKYKGKVNIVLKHNSTNKNLNILAMDCIASKSNYKYLKKYKRYNKQLSYAYNNGNRQESRIVKSNMVHEAKRNLRNYSKREYNRAQKILEKDIKQYEEANFKKSQTPIYIINGKVVPRKRFQDFEIAKKTIDMILRKRKI